jgi:hypothetical protein
MLIVCGDDEAEQAWAQFVEAIVDDVDAPDVEGMPHISRASLTKVSGNPLSPLRLQLAYPTTTRREKSGKQAVEFGYTLVRDNPCMLFLIKKLGGF